MSRSLQLKNLLCVSALGTLAFMPHAVLAQTAPPSPAPSATPAASPAPSASPSEAPAPERRALPAPLDPIFPSTDFNGPTIGVPTDPGIRTYGWMNAGIALSTSHFSNAPLSYMVVPNAAEVDQFVFRIERQPNTVQTAHPDWGFRISNIYGADWRFTTAEGWWSDQLLSRNQVNGYDAPELYGILYAAHWKTDGFPNRALHLSTRH